MLNRQIEDIQKSIDRCISAYHSLSGYAKEEAIDIAVDLYYIKRVAEDLQIYADCLLVPDEEVRP